MHMHMPPAKITLTEAHAQRLRQVQRLLSAYGQITGRPPLSDLELLSMIEGMDDLAMSENQTFLALVNDDFNLVNEDHHMQEHYYQATQDIVTDAVEERGLRFDPHDYYAMHIGAVGGLLDSDDVELLGDALQAAHGPRVQVHQDGDNYMEWGEPLDNDPAADPGTAAWHAAHVILWVPFGEEPHLADNPNHPDKVMETVRAALPDVVWLNADQIAETTSNFTRIGDPDVPYALTEVRDHSATLNPPCQWCRRMVMDEEACGNDHTICEDCCGLC